MEKIMKKILALILAVSLVLMLASCKDPEVPTPEAPAPEIKLTPLFDIDLSSYIEIDESYYKNLTVEVKTNKVTDLDVDNAIIQMLRANKDKTALENGDGIISVGDVVNIFYKGYYIETDSEGKETKVYFDGGSNVGGVSYALEIGSGGFIPGFEYNMIGKNVADYDSENPMLIEAYFPEDYGMATLNGKTSYFEVYVDLNDDGSYKIVEYSAPELTEEFIKDTLKFTDEILAEYEGETVLEQYRSYVRYVLKWNGIDTASAAWNAFWESVLKGAVIKQYPTEYVTQAYNEIIADLNTVFENYSSHYTYEQFACLYLGVSVGSDWQTEARSIAQEQVKQQLIFYYIMDKEGLDPTAEEYEILFDRYLTDALASENVTPDKFNTEEEYIEHKKQYRAKMISSYGEEYFKEKIVFGIGYEAVIGFANIVEITE